MGPGLAEIKITRHAAEKDTLRLNHPMSFAVPMILLLAMGSWVLYELLRIRRARKEGSTPETDMRRTHPVLYWTIVAAQLLFLIGCLYKLYALFEEAFP